MRSIFGYVYKVINRCDLLVITGGWSKVETVDATQLKNESIPELDDDDQGQKYVLIYVRCVVVVVLMVIVIVLAVAIDYYHLK